MLLMMKDETKKRRLILNVSDFCVFDVFVELIDCLFHTIIFLFCLVGGVMIMVMMDYISG